MILPFQSIFCYDAGMSELAKLEMYLVPKDVFALLDRRYSQRSKAEPEGDAPDFRDVRYIGVMSEIYPSSYYETSLDRLLRPVESAAELFSIVPEGYAYIGSLISVEHARAGKMAIPLGWSGHACTISGLAQGMIRVLVGVLLTQLADGVLPPTLPQGSATEDAGLARKDLTPDVWAKHEELYDLLCQMFGEIHEVYYGDYPGKYTDRIPNILKRNNLVATALAESLTNEGNLVLQILLKLGGEHEATWVAGFRELGTQVMCQFGVFGGDNLIAWKSNIELAIQKEFELACRHHVATRIYILERHKQRTEKD